MGGKMGRIVFFGILSLLMFTSCNTVTSPDELCQSQGVWRLSEFSNGATVSIPNPDNYTLQFETEGSVSVRADCNVCNGSYEMEGNSLSIGPLACTRAFCGPLSFFDQYTAALSTVSSFARRGDELELTYSGGTMKFATTISSSG
jgi:heat shock protein HslJ